jgi:hypothetical protein
MIGQEMIGYARERKVFEFMLLVRHGIVEGI